MMGVRRILAELEARRSRRRISALVTRGLRLGRDVLFMPGVSLDRTYPWLIEIGDGCRISRDVRVIAHDATTFVDLGVTRLGEVRILAHSFVGERAIILPGVTIEPHALVAAGSVVNRDVGEGMVVAGNPARVVGRFDEILDRVRASVLESVVHDMRAVLDGEIDREEIRRALRDGRGVYVSGSQDGSPFHHNVSDAAVHAAARDALNRTMSRPAADAGTTTGVGRSNVCERRCRAPPRVSPGICCC